jgi:hypothetical protein
MKTLPLFCLFLFCITNASAQEEIKTDTLQVRFLYGSKPHPQHRREQKKWFGGMLGGHVGIRYDSLSYLSFFYEGRVHIFQYKNEFCSQYELQSDSAFNYIMDGDVDSVKTLIIHIPISKTQRQKFEEVCANYIAETPYDYAFFGVRCGSSTYDVLMQSGLIKELSYRRMWWKIFYPKKLRSKLIRQARKNNWRMEKKKGTHKRSWETDETN